MYVLRMNVRRRTPYVLRTTYDDVLQRTYDNVRTPTTAEYVRLTTYVRTYVRRTHVDDVRRRMYDLSTNVRMTTYDDVRT